MPETNRPGEPRKPITFRRGLQLLHFVMNSDLILIRSGNYPAISHNSGPTFQNIQELKARRKLRIHEKDFGLFLTQSAKGELSQRQPRTCCLQSNVL